MIDDHETTGFRIVFRQWPVGYDPLSKGEKPYQTPAPSDKSVHGKLALPSLKGPTAPRERQRPALTATRDDLARPRARSVRRPLQSCETVRQGARNALRLRGFVSGQSTGPQASS